MIQPRSKKYHLGAIIITRFIGLTSACFELVDQSYKNYESFMNKSSIGQRTWFPNIISEDAVNLREVHDIDNNSSFGRFEYEYSEYYDSIFSDTTNFKTGTINEFIDGIQSMGRRKTPDWFVDIELIKNKKMEIILIDRFIVTRDKKSKSIYFIAKAH